MAGQAVGQRNFAEPAWSGHAVAAIVALLLGARLVHLACSSQHARAPTRTNTPRTPVQVDMSLYHNLGGHEKLVASCTGIFKKLGALRAL